MNTDIITSLPIKDLHIVANRIVRGETLFASKNRQWLPVIHDAGITTIIDLRTADHTARYADICKAVEIQYYHIPIDRCIQTDKEVIESLPLLFSLLDTGNCYISCQQGKHRTDITMALYYLFHNGMENPPLLYGHYKTDGTLRIDDIMRRAHSVLNALKENDKELLGLSMDYSPEFLRKKKLLLEYNRNEAKLNSIDNKAHEK